MTQKMNRKYLHKTTHRKKPISWISYMYIVVQSNLLTFMIKMIEIYYIMHILAFISRSLVHHYDA